MRGIIGVNTQRLAQTLPEYGGKLGPLSDKTESGIP